MDYKYIEQLLERYWQGETSLEEEAILRAFFAQKDVPSALQHYQPLFICESEEAGKNVLGDDFDARILALTEGTTMVQARTIRLTDRLMPLFKAAAVVAIILTLGNAAQLSMPTQPSSDEIDYSAYKDTYQDPAMAYDNVENALQLVSEGIIQVQEADSMTTTR